MPLEGIYTCALKECGQKAMRSRLKNHIPEGWIWMELTQWIPDDEGTTWEFTEVFCSMKCYRFWLEQFESVKIMAEQADSERKAMQ